MNSHSDKVLLFPKVNEAKIHEQKLEKTLEIRHQIMEEMKRNKTASLYNIYDDKYSQVSFALKRKKQYEGDHYCRKFYSQRKKSPKSQNQLRSANKKRIINVNANEQNSSRQTIKKCRFSNYDEKQSKQYGILSRHQQLSSNKKYRNGRNLRIKTQDKIQAHQNLSLINPKIFKEFINIKSILTTLDQGILIHDPDQRKYFKARQKTKRYYHKMDHSKKQKNTDALKDLKLKFTLLHGWKTDQQECKLFAQ